MCGEDCRVPDGGVGDFAFDRRGGRVDVCLFAHDLVRLRVDDVELLLHRRELPLDSVELLLADADLLLDDADLLLEGPEGGVGGWAGVFVWHSSS